MTEPSADVDNIARQIVDASILVHKELGPGLLESVYEVCLMDVLLTRGLSPVRQLPISVKFQNRSIDAGFRADMIVNGQVIVEIKSAEKLAGIHDAQLLTYRSLHRLNWNSF